MHACMHACMHAYIYIYNVTHVMCFTCMNFVYGFLLIPRLNTIEPSITQISYIELHEVPVHTHKAHQAFEKDRTIIKHICIQF